jgi:hypothetical protein
MTATFAKSCPVFAYVSHFRRRLVFERVHIRSDRQSESRQRDHHHRRHSFGCSSNGNREQTNVDTIAAQGSTPQNLLRCAAVKVSLIP